MYLLLWRCLWLCLWHECDANLTKVRGFTNTHKHFIQSLGYCWFDGFMSQYFAFFVYLSRQFEPNALFSDKRPIGNIMPHELRAIPETFTIFTRHVMTINQVNCMLLSIDLLNSITRHHTSRTIPTVNAVCEFLSSCGNNNNTRTEKKKRENKKNSKYIMLIQLLHLLRADFCATLKLTNSFNILHRHISEWVVFFIDTVSAYTKICIA